MDVYTSIYTHMCAHNSICSQSEGASCLVSPVHLSSSLFKKKVQYGGRVSCSSLLTPTSLGPGDPWSMEFQEGPGLLAQRPQLKNVAGLGLAGTSVYIPAAEASPLAGIPERCTWVPLDPCLQQGVNTCHPGYR